MRRFNSKFPVFAEEMEPPVGEPCLRCAEPIAATDPGVSMPHIDANGVARMAMLHLECHARATFGSIGHQTKQCPCFGGTYEDPPGLTMRQAARVAADFAFSMTPGVATWGW